MDPARRNDLLLMLKAIGQEQRLLLIGFMSEGEQNVSTLAHKLGLKEPTVSHHLSKLQAAGLLNLRMAGNQRFYRLNQKRLQSFREHVALLDTPPTVTEKPENDLSWLDAFDFSAADKKVLKDYTFNGRLQKIPRKEAKLLVVLRWLITKFEPDRFYTEKEVNEIIKTVNVDYATLRRDLIEFGYMRRERGGGSYWMAPDDETALS